MVIENTEKETKNEDETKTNNKPDEKEIPCHFGIESLDAETG